MIPKHLRPKPVLLLAVVALMAMSFEAGRRYPFEFLNRFRPSAPTMRAPSGWDSVAEIPETRYEAATAVWRGRLYVFSGFRNATLQATPRLDIWDSRTRTWTRAGDITDPTTHRNARLVGDTIWFAGGFVGDHPGPVTDRVDGYDPDSDSWFEGPPLPAVRGGGALVADGRVLHYFGGYGADKGVRSDHWALDLDAWLAGGPSWQARAPVPTPRGHITGASADGLLYAIGGAVPHDPYSSDLREVHRYDPATDTWSEVASLPFPSSHTEPGTFVRDGRIWMVGGRSHPRASAARDIMVYDPSEDRWMHWQRLPRGLLAPTAAAIGDVLYVAGGGDAENNPENVKTVWSASLDPGWWPGRPMPEPLGEVAAGLIGNRLVVVGEGSAATHVYDIGTGLWAGAERIVASRPFVGNHHAAEIIGGSLYLLGGLGAGAGQMQIFDVASNTWKLGPELPFEAGSSASAVIGDKIYVGGGIDGRSTIADAAEFDLATETWTFIAPMPNPRNHAASGTDGVRWYVFGGRGPGSGDANVVANGFGDVQVYDPKTDTWTVSGGGPDAPTPMPVGRGGTGKAVYVHGRFYVIGGETLDGPGANQNGVYSRVDIYDPETNVWTEGPPLSTPRHGLFPVTTGGRIFVVGGGERSGASASAALEILDVMP